MSGTYNVWLVCLSVVVAIVVSYTALNLVARVAKSRPRIARMWLLGGALAMGVGIWSMHFVGMLAYTLPIPLTYNWLTTLGSLGIAIAICGFALSIASRKELSASHLLASGTVMGLGISAMHYSGMSAIEIVPLITYDTGLFTASIAIAVVASVAALWLAFRLRTGRSWQMHLARVGAAIVMGLAISGMHYTGMEASQFAPDSYCIGGIPLATGWLAISVAVFALALLTITLVLVVYDAHLDSSTRKHSKQLEAANEQLQHLATHDALTGLPNRLLLADRLGQAIGQAEHSGTQFAVMVLDLDRFKSINDSLGHQAGDDMLREVARRLGSMLRKADTLARLGGDEFVLVINSVAGARDVESVANKILDMIRRPLTLSGVEVHPSPSIGVSIYPSDATDAETLLVHADAAMYHAKKNGRNMFQFFSPEMNAFARERLELENGLRRGLAQNEFELHYQPKVDLSGGRIQSAEALIRWRHPTKGMIAPGNFIPLAEETGLILQIGEWVLREACRQARAWQAEGLALRVAVNLSAQQFRHRNLIGLVRNALAEAALEPRFLEIELTESAVMQDAEASAHILRELADLGVRISVDDFGTGYSSLSYLKRLPLDKLKIDRSFIRDVVANSDDAAIVSAIVSLAHSLRLKVIAEGVETPEQLQFLRSLGCDQYQGFHCSPAVPARDFVTLMHTQQPAPAAEPAVDLNDTIIARRLRRV